MSCQTRLFRNRTFRRNILFFRTSFGIYHFRPFSLASVSARTSNDEHLKSFEALPGPKNVPLLGSGLHVLWQTRRQPLGKVFLQKQFIDVHKYGRISKLKLPGVDIVQLADPAAASEILRNDPLSPKRFDSPVIDHYRAKSKAKPGVFYANGPDWSEYRSAVGQKILKPKEAEDYASDFNAISDEFLERVHSSRGQKETDFENEVIDLNEELFKWSLESITQVLFNRRFGCLQGKVIDQDAQIFLDSIQGFLHSFMPLTYMPVWLFKLYQAETYREFIYHFNTMYSYADLFIGKKIKEMKRRGKFACENEDERAAFFCFLVSSGRLTEDDIVASVIDLLFSAIDSTSNTMLWALYLMGDNPDKQYKLHKEISSVVSPGETITAESVAQMPYLGAWLKETLRLYPVLSALPRILPHETNLLGYNLPAGTNVNILSYYMGRDESVFEDAHLFNPERWLQDRGTHTAAEDIYDFASIPFGLGSRICEGRRIAELQLSLLIAKTVQRFIVTYPHKDDVEPFMRGVTTPDRPVRVKFLDRPLK